MERYRNVPGTLWNACGTLSERTWNAVERLWNDIGTLWNAPGTLGNAYQKQYKSFFVCPYEAEGDSAPSGRGLRVAVEEPSCSFEFVSATEWH